MFQKIEFNDNHLSNEFQLRAIEEISLAVKDELKKCTLGTDDLATRDILLDLLEAFYTLTDFHLNEVRENKSTVNNVKIMSFLADIKRLVAGPQKKLKEPMVSLQKISDLCDTWKEHYKHAVEINIYQIKIPQSEFKKLNTHLEKFYFEGKLTLAKQVTQGVLGTVVSGVGLCLGILTPPIDYCHRKVDELMDYHQNSKRSITTGFKQYGFACRRNLLPGSLEVEDKINWENPVARLHEEKSTDDIKILYILDCQSIQTFSDLGTNFFLEHSLSNKIGHSILFDSLESAVRYAERNKKGLNYDKMGGWLIDDVWTISDRLNLRKYFEKIKEVSPYPIVLTNIIIEYLGPSSSPEVVKNLR